MARENSQDYQKYIEKRPELISWNSFCEANSTFAGDYAIVHHEGTYAPGIFDEPNRAGEYSVSQVGKMTEEEFHNTVEGKNVVVLIMCMDRRAQHQTYEAVKKLHPDSMILTLSMGGGIVQQDKIDRPEGEVVVNRSGALATELSYVADHANVEAIYATGHDCQCGACKFFANDVPVHEQLSATLHREVGKGGIEETQEMGIRVAEGVQELIPASVKDVTRAYVVHIDPTTDVYEEMIEV